MLRNIWRCRSPSPSMTLLVLSALFPATINGLAKHFPAATVIGSRQRNATVRRGTVALSGPDTEDEFGCDYCSMEACVEERRGRRGSQPVVFCYALKDEFDYLSPDTSCVSDQDVLRALVVAEHLTEDVTQACQVAKDNPNHRVCWCRATLKRNLSRSEQVQERSRLRFNTGHRGGVTVVHYQSADKASARSFQNLIRSPQTLRHGPRVQASGLARAGPTMSSPNKGSEESPQSNDRLPSRGAAVSSRLASQRRPSTFNSIPATNLSLIVVIFITAIAYFC